MIRSRATAAAVAVVSVAIAVGAAAGARGHGASAEHRHAAFDSLLARYVAPGGVRYAAWAASAADRAALRDYVKRLAAADPEALPRHQRLAYWINVYNAVTLDLVLTHYPVASIKDIASPWKRKRITVQGRKLSLDEIENAIIRKIWDEPRIHFALNCAAVSCPPLRSEAFDGRRLDEQLEEQTRAFLADSSTNFVDARGALHLSRIFGWYRGDFEKDGALVDWLRPYVPALQGRAAGDVKIEIGDYDWSLNEAAPGK